MGIDLRAVMLLDVHVVGVDVFDEIRPLEFELLSDSLQVSKALEVHQRFTVHPHLIADSNLREYLHGFAVDYVCRRVMSQGTVLFEYFEGDSVFGEKSPKSKTDRSCSDYSYFH